MCTAMDEIKPSIYFIVNCLNIKQEMFGIICLHELSSPWGFFTHIETSTWKWGTYGHCDWLFVVLRHFGSISAIERPWPLSDGFQCRLREPVTLAPVDKRLTVQMSLSVLTIRVCRDQDSNTWPSAWESNILTKCAKATAMWSASSL